MPAEGRGNASGIALGNLAYNAKGSPYYEAYQRHLELSLLKDNFIKEKFIK